MSEELQNQVAETPAPEQAPTAEPVAEETQAPEDQPTEQQTKTFTQEELDAIVGKRLAREQRKWEREQARKAQSAPIASPAELPAPEEFNSVDEYAEALAARKAEELLAKREADRQRMEMLEAYQDREEEARNKYDDFEQVAYNPNLRITNVMAETIQASDIGPDVAYYLGANPKEADRISRLTPFLQAKEIGKIEAKLSSEPVLKKTTSAPPPISPVKGSGGAAPVMDTTDPRSVKSLSTSEWIEAERQRQIKKLQAQQNR